MRCPHCGQEHPDSTIFCPTTGRKLIATRYCSNCGAEIQESWRVCPKCGTPVDETIQSSFVDNKAKRSSIQSSKLIFVLLFALILLIAIAYLIFEQRSETPQVLIDVATFSPTATIAPTFTTTPTPTITLTPTPVISWSKSVVESSGNRPGPFLSMDTGSDGTFDLAYFLDSTDDLKIVEGNGRSWTALRNLAQLNKEGRSVGFYINLDLDSNNVPYLAYLISDKSTGRGVFQTSNGTWSSSAIGQNLDIFDMRVTVDTTGTPHYAVLAQNGDILYRTSKTDLARIANGAIPPASVEVNFRYFPIALAVDSSQSPYICFSKSSTLQCIYNQGNSWDLMTVAENGIYPSLQIDALGNLHLAYYDYQEKSLKYAFLPFHSSKWVIDTVDSTENAGWYPSLKVDTKNLVRISYYDAGNMSLKYALGQLGGWSIYTVDNDGNVGLISSLVVDSKNNPAIAYFDSDKRSIYFTTGSQK
jgi:double zinc ribbon protein